MGLAESIVRESFASLDPFGLQIAIRLRLWTCGDEIFAAHEWIIHLIIGSHGSGWIDGSTCFFYSVVILGCTHDSS